MPPFDIIIRCCLSPSSASLQPPGTHYSRNNKESTLGKDEERKRKMWGRGEGGGITFTKSKQWLTDLIRSSLAIVFFWPRGFLCFVHITFMIFLRRLLVTRFSLFIYIFRSSGPWYTIILSLAKFAWYLYRLANSTMIAICSFLRKVATLLAF